MNRFVYLFELDSVRNNPKEIEIGQAALFEEIVKNGNTVVLAFNQLADSEAFLSAVKDKETYESIVELFTMGALKVSQFGKTRTASQYMQDSIHKCLGTEGDKFLFSGVPVLCTDKELLQIIGDALKYSDVGVLREMAAAETDSGEKERLEYIERFIRMILLLSVEEPAGHPAKQVKKHSFMEFYDKIIEILPHMPESKKGDRTSSQDNTAYDQGIQDTYEIYEEEIKKLLSKTLTILKEVKYSLETGQRNNRTNWVNRINEYKNEACQNRTRQDEVCQDNECEDRFDTYYLAEAIVDLCYNYTVEDSIYEISKHYLDDEDSSGENDNGRPARFADDFWQRLTEYWKSYRMGIHMFCKGDKNEREEYKISLPCWNSAVRVIKSIKKQDKKSGYLYEENYKKERKQWQALLTYQMAARFGTALVYIILFCLADLGISLAEDSLFEAVSWLQPEIIPQAVWNVIYSTILFGIVGSAVAEIFHLPDILESLKGIVMGVRDSYKIIKTPRNIAHYNKLYNKDMNHNIGQESEKHV